MSENGWKSKILESLGAKSIDCISSGKSSLSKNLTAALVISATAAMSTFSAESVYAADVNQIDIEEFSAVSGIDQDAKDFEILFENPYGKKYKIKDQEKGFVSKASDVLNKLPGGYDREYDKDRDDKPIVRDTPHDHLSFVNIVSAISSPISYIADRSTEAVLENGDPPPFESREITRTIGEMGGSTLTSAVMGAGTGGATVVALTALSGVRGIVHIAEVSQNKDHAKAQVSVDLARERMSEIYIEERQKIRLADSARNGEMQSTAHRVDVGLAASDGLETSTDDLETLFNDQKHENKHKNDGLEP